MARVIHCRIRNGQPVFRIWSTVTDSYITEPLSKEEVIEKFKDLEVRDITERLNSKLPNSVSRAKQNGTSSEVAASQDINGPWEEQRN